MYSSIIGATDFYWHININVILIWSCFFSSPTTPFPLSQISTHVYFKIKNTQRKYKIVFCGCSHPWDQGWSFRVFVIWSDIAFVRRMWSKLAGWQGFLAGTNDSCVPKVPIDHKKVFRTLWSDSSHTQMFGHTHNFGVDHSFSGKDCKQRL